MKCPECGLINPDIAQRCDCGYDFQCKGMRESYAKVQTPARAERPDRIRLGLGCLLCYFSALAQYPKELPISGGIVGGTLAAIAISSAITYLWKGRQMPRNWKQVSFVFVGISLLLLCGALIQARSNF
jgi:hypothetical protein